MSGTASVPNTFATQSGNVPASQLDANWTALVNYINQREITLGTLAARPVASVSGRLYYATDSQVLFEDNGSVWTALAGQGVAAGGTGSTTLLANSIIIGEGTSAVHFLLLTKGQLIVGQTGADPQALPISTDGQVLTLDSTTTLGVKWAPAGGTGTGISIGEFYGLQPTTIPVR